MYAIRSYYAVPISSPVTVRVADGRTSVVGNSVSIDLTVGSLRNNFV